MAEAFHWSKRQRIEKELKEDSYDDSATESFHPITRRKKPAVSKAETDIETLKNIFCNYLGRKDLQKIASVSRLWCKLAYGAIREKIAKQYDSVNIPFVRWWEQDKWAALIYSGRLHYHSELLTSGNNNIITEVETVITFATQSMQDAYFSDTMKLPRKKTIIFCFVDRVILNNPKCWNPFSDCSLQSGNFEDIFMVGSLFIPKSNFFNITPFSIPLSTIGASEFCTKENMWNILLKKYGMEGEEGHPCIKAVLFFQCRDDPFLSTFIDAIIQENIQVLGVTISAFGCNTIDGHCALFGVGLAVSANTGDATLLNISTYAISKFDPNPQKKIFEIEDHCRNYLNKFIILVSRFNEYTIRDCSNSLYSEEGVCDAQMDRQTEDNCFIIQVMQIFRNLMPDVPMIGATTTAFEPLIVGNTAFGNSGNNNEPADVGFLVVAYN